MRNTPWLRRALVVVLVLLAVDFGVSRLLRTHWARRYLVARLEVAFGRPVDVGQFDFSLLDGLALEADSVTVGEDPRFGYEYFLRAERLRAGLRWREFFRGRFAFGALSFSHPSLNLVRAADGRWNVESWLPPTPAGPVGPVPAPKTPLRLYRIAVDAGRINLKRGPEKLPFALVDVSGRLDEVAPGRWQVDLEASPARAAVALQEVGTLRLRGSIGGTSARLQPAELTLTWQGASLADVLRLLRGWDFGVRGDLALELTARSAPPAPAGNLSAAGRASRWRFNATARLTHVHRWDLPPRLTDPAVNLIVAADWLPGVARVEMSRCTIEAPRSSLQAVGYVSWAPQWGSALQLASSRISFADLLAWYRAFHSGVADDLAVEGGVGLDVRLGGWPPRFEQVALEGAGARVRSALLSDQVEFGRLTAGLSHGRLVLAPTTVAFAASAGRQPVFPSVLRIAGSLALPVQTSPRGPNAWGFELALDGGVGRVENLLALINAFGYAPNRGWSIAGPVRAQLRWQGALRPFAARALGTLELHGTQLRADFLNQPAVFPQARIDLLPAERRVTLAAARAFGTEWKGSLWSGETRRPGAGGAAPPVQAGSSAGWQFDLSADRLDLAELDRWLGPRARPSFFQRIVPFAAPGPESAERYAALGLVRTQGRLRLGVLNYAPLVLRRLDAQASVDGRRIVLRAARAEFFGGTLEGSLDARLQPEPIYESQAAFEGVNLESLADSTTALRNRFAGSASGRLELIAHGVGRENLVRSIEGRGNFRVRNAVVRGFDLREIASARNLSASAGQFSDAEGRFFITGGALRFEKLALASSAGVFNVEGGVSLTRGMGVDLLLTAPAANVAPGDAPGKGSLPGPAPAVFRLRGPLDRVAVAPAESRPARRVAPGKR